MCIVRRRRFLLSSLFSQTNDSVVSHKNKNQQQPAAHDIQNANTVCYAMQSNLHKATQAMIVRAALIKEAKRRYIKHFRERQTKVSNAQDEDPVLLLEKRISSRPTRKRQNRNKMRPDPSGYATVQFQTPKCRR